MSAFSDFLENAVLNHVLRNSPYTAPTAVYVALFTAAPSDAGGGTEVSGGAYARQAVTFGAASGGSVTNSAAVNFPKATAAWGTVTHFALFDAATAGNMLVWAPLSASKAINTDDTASYAIGALSVTLA